MANTQQKIQSRYITLHEWGELMFAKVPHANTLLNWVHNGHIHPKPEKIGRKWHVKRDARYVS